MTDLIVPLIAGCFSIVGTLISSPIWAPGFWLRRTIADTSAALAAAPAGSVAYKALLRALDICSTKLTASLLVPLKLGWCLFSCFGTAGAWAFGVLLKSSAFSTISAIGFFAVYALGMVYLLRVQRLRVRQATAMRAGRTSGFFVLRSGEFRARTVVSQRLIDGDLSIAATIRLVAERHERRALNSPTSLTPTFQ